MKKFNKVIVALANDINTFAFDLDPYNGADETEALECVFGDLLEGAEYSKEFLSDIIKNEEEAYCKEDIEEASKLLQRVEEFCKLFGNVGNQLELMIALRQLGNMGFDLDRNSARCLIDSMYEIRDINRGSARG